MKKQMRKAGMSVAGNALEKRFGQGEPADMHLPSWILGLGAVLVVAAALLAIDAALGLFIALKIGSAGTAAIAVAALVLGAAAVLCWRNQKIFIRSEETFEYRTFLGNSRTYRFDEIEGVKQNQDSMTLLVRGDKVHIESCAILSQQLIDRINGALQ